MRVDAHGHIAQERWIGPTWWDAVAEESGRRVGMPAETVRELVVPAYFDEDGSAQLGSMDEAGIDVAIMFPFDWSRAEGLEPAEVGWREQNDWYARFAAEHAERVRWGFGADPRHDGAAEAFERALDDGAVCLKLHPGAGFALDGPVVEPFLVIARDAGVPVVAHVGPLPPPLRDEGASPGRLRRIAERFPSVTFQAGHCGNEAWRETLDAIRALDNVVVDLSGWQVRFAEDAPRFYSDVREVIDALGSERVLWGTDPPYYRPLVPDSTWLAAFTHAPTGTFSDAEIERIVGGNAARVFGLGREREVR